MQRATWLAMLLACVLAVSVTGTAFAQNKPHDAKAQKDKRARVQKRLEQIRNRILKKEVGLDDKKAAEVEKVFVKYEGDRRKLGKEVREHRQALRKLLKENSDDEAAYKKEVVALREAQKKQKALGERETAELSKILTHKEQAKLMAALQRLRRVLARRAAAAAAKQGD